MVLVQGPEVSEVWHSVYLEKKETFNGSDTKRQCRPLLPDSVGDLNLNKSYFVRRV